MLAMVISVATVLYHSRAAGIALRESRASGSCATPYWQGQRLVHCKALLQLTHFHRRYSRRCRACRRYLVKASHSFNSLQCGPPFLEPADAIWVTFRVVPTQIITTLWALVHVAETRLNDAPIVQSGVAGLPQCSRVSHRAVTTTFPTARH